MARGDLVQFQEFPLELSKGGYNLETDSFSMILITTLPVNTDASPDRADYTEVTAGGSYVTGGIALTVTLAEVGGVTTFDITNAPSWAKLAGSPTDIKAGLIVNNTHAGTQDAIAAVDLTTDGGTTAISMVDSTITATPNASGLYTITI